MYIKNRTRPSTEPCGTPAVTVPQDEYSPLTSTRCSLFDKYMELENKLLRLPVIPTHSSLWSNPWCHTRSKAFEILPRTINFPSRQELEINYGICGQVVLQYYHLGWKLDWNFERRSLSQIWLNIYLTTHFSRHFSTAESSETGL